MSPLGGGEWELSEMCPDSLPCLVACQELPEREGITAVLQAHLTSSSGAKTQQTFSVSIGQKKYCQTNDFAAAYCEACWLKVFPLKASGKIGKGRKKQSRSLV